MIQAPFFTADRALYRKVMLKQGETMLISTGGESRRRSDPIGQVEQCPCLHDRWIEGKANRVRQLGADAPINYLERDFVAEVQKPMDGKGVNVIIENVAADNFGRNFYRAPPNARIVLIGSGNGQSHRRKLQRFRCAFQRRDDTRDESS
jgi:NADPH2:quinone reductase